jgi:hypothetical protein
MGLDVPEPLKREHEELHKELRRAVQAGGRTGKTARAVAERLHPHFVKEEAYALPPLGLLARLARGEYVPEATEAAAMADRLKAELPSMLAEHREIVAALDALTAAAREGGTPSTPASPRSWPCTPGPRRRCSIRRRSSSASTCGSEVWPTVSRDPKGRCIMSNSLIIPTLLVGLFAAPLSVQAHCDGIGGPVTTAALRALDAGNVNLVLPYAPASAEPELSAAFAQAAAVRGLSPEAKALAERYLMETAVRLHRAGEGAPYEGLKPPGTDFGPAIPAAERVLEDGQVEPLLVFLSDEIKRGVTERFGHALAARGAPKEPASAAELPAARERIGEEFAFIGYVEGLYQAIMGGRHIEGATAASDCGRQPDRG